MPTVELVYGAPGCMAICEVREDVVAGVVWMLEFHRAECNTVLLHAGEPGRMSPVSENAEEYDHALSVDRLQISGLTFKKDRRVQNYWDTLIRFVLNNHKLLTGTK